MEADKHADYSKLEQELTRQQSDSLVFSASRKAFFLTSMPFYWLFLFRIVLDWFDWRWFTFVVVLSAVLSLFGGGTGWGILDGLL